MATKTPKRNAVRSRIAILDAAEKLFAERGPNGVSLAEIGECAGVSRGLPSYFFSDKETLYRTVFEQAATELRSAIAEVMQSAQEAPPAQILMNLTDSYMDYLAAHPTIVRLLQWNTLESTASHGASLASRVPGSLFDETLESLSKRIGAKAINGIDVRDLLLSLVSICLYPFHIRPAEPREVKRRKKHIRSIIFMMSRTTDE